VRVTVGCDGVSEAGGLGGGVGWGGCAVRWSTSPSAAAPSYMKAGGEKNSEPEPGTLTRTQPEPRARSLMIIPAESTTVTVQLELNLSAALPQWQTLLNRYRAVTPVLNPGVESWELLPFLLPFSTREFFTCRG
jgi:hypothetical protein